MTNPVTGNIQIRNEHPKDYRSVEELIRTAFWNVYTPGCYEHYLVHIMRAHPDFVTKLDLVLTVDDKIVGIVMFTKAKLIAENAKIKQVLTLGPLAIHPDYQRLGLGKRLINEALERAHKLEFDTVILMGAPSNYVGAGFKSAMRYDVSMGRDQYLTALLVKELVPGVLAGHHWHFESSPVMDVDMNAVDVFDQEFDALPKEWRPSQEEFYIISHSYMQK